MKALQKRRGDRIPIFSWCADVEEGALEQAHNLASHPATFHHVALMPDTHRGYGMPIGGVIACENAVIPNAVGVDIGCGMAAVKTSATRISAAACSRIIEKLKAEIPVGFDHHETDQSWDGFNDAPDIPVIQQQLASARRQLGTLGGGNHFIEIQEGDDGNVWLMLHSGSRNFGYKIAKEYNRLAMGLCEKWHSQLPPGNGEDSLAFLPIGTKEAREYITAMSFALSFAKANRAAMLNVFKKIARAELGCTFEQEINVHHNFAAYERHFGRDVWVHRKGATQANAGQFGIIPGSMGTASYIVTGLGNRDSFESCSHGAGRAMGRAEFCRTHTQEECETDMDGIVFGGWGIDRKGNPDISEAPKAYKDIHEVMSAQADLVTPEVILKPLAVMKG